MRVSYRFWHVRPQNRRLGPLRGRASQNQTPQSAHLMPAPARARHAARRRVFWRWLHSLRLAFVQARALTLFRWRRAS